MTHDMSDVRFWAKIIAIVLATAAVLVLYARGLRCVWCDSRYAIYERNRKDWCRSCAKVFDAEVRQAQRSRPPLPWRRSRRSS